MESGAGCQGAESHGEGWAGQCGSLAFPYRGWGGGKAGQGGGPEGVYNFPRLGTAW